MHLRDGLEPRLMVIQRYRHLVETGAIARDAEQERVAGALDRLTNSIAERGLATKSSSLGWLFARKREAPAPIKGLYVYGGVGRGKTMLMDMFYELLPVRRKRRAHFNDFMGDVHDRIARQRQARKEGTVKEDDPIPPVAKALAEEATVLCFDEFSVTDIADAMILSRLFSSLFAEGVVLVATSNVAPDNLYRDGLNRSLFLPFIDTLKRNADVMTLDGPTDYRLEKIDRLSVYLTPLGPDTDARMDTIWRSMTQGATAHQENLTVKGRTVPVPVAAGRCARFEFADLCEKPLAAREYLAITDHYDSLLVDHVPVLDPTRRSATKRFILLVDTLYDRKVRAVFSAEVTPEKLYAGRPGTTEAFEFDRTVSRLIEMQSKEWLQVIEQRIAGRAAAQ